MLYGRPTVGNEPRKLIAIRLDVKPLFVSEVLISTV
jgi:hypothetical protein